jgi:hypothetical protein
MSDNKFTPAMTDAECEEFISSQLDELGKNSGVIVQPDGCSKEQFQRIAETMGLRMSHEVPVECTAGLGMPKAMKRDRGVLPSNKEKI